MPKINLNQLEELEELEPNQVKVCTCQQCIARKTNISSNTKKTFKRLCNKKARKLQGKVYNHYWS